MLRLLRAELMKMRRSLIWIATLIIPVFVFGLMTFGLTKVEETIPWQPLIFGVANVWAYFLLPMTVTILTALLGQVEHRYNTWSYPLSLPYRKTTVLLVKGLIAIGLIGVISGLLMLAVYGAGTLAGELNAAGGMIGEMPWDYFTKMMRRIWMASFLLIAVQFYIAMRFGGLALPLLVGIGGTLLAVIANSVRLFGVSFDEGNYLPWLLPANVLAGVPDRTEMSLLIGGGGGAALLVLVCVLLARKDWS